MARNDKFQSSIEDGYFIFTLMPSLRCSLNCPHCYLSKEERRSSAIMSIEDLETVCNSVREYFEQRKLDRAVIRCYWYGGEPTEMGIDYFSAAAKMMGRVFSNPRFRIDHTILTSLLNVSEDWYDIFSEHCSGEIQTSFDWTMRGSGYVKKWERAVRSARNRGLRVSTISVVNKDLIALGPGKALDYLTDLGVSETSWLPFMWNQQNDSGSYAKFAPSMSEYSDFMIALSRRWVELVEANMAPPEIGQLRFVIAQKANNSGFSNIAAQTLFLMPDGSFCLPDYKNGYQEYMRTFGNALEVGFKGVLESTERRDYIRKQVLRNKNEECLACEHSDKCLMEFWKENREGDDCFGAKRFVEWVVANQDNLPSRVNDEVSLY